jgi:hypothetical protein
MSSAQSFLLFLIELGGAAIVVLSLLVRGGLLLPVAGLRGLRHPRVPA